MMKFYSPEGSRHYWTAYDIEGTGISAFGYTQAEAESLCLKRIEARKNGTETDDLVRLSLAAAIQNSSGRANP